MQVKNRWNKLSRLAGAGALSLAVLLGNVLPAHAEAVPVAPAVSPWSISTLTEGEKYGIFPLGWYTDGTFQQSITAEKFKSLMNATAVKLDKLELKKKDAALSFTADGAITRETVITALHKLLATYELPEAFGMNESQPIEYMQQKGIVKGTLVGLELDKPITVEQAAVMSSRLVEFTYDTLGKGSEGMMWKVSKGKNTLYLLGSIHMGNNDMYPMQKDIREAFDKSDNMWVEVDTLNSDMTYFLNQMQYQEGKQLKDHVSAATYEKLQKVLTKLKLPANSFDAYKPFAISLNLTNLSYYENPTEMMIGLNTGVENYFISKALLTGKPIHELESIKLQADLFSSVPAEQQEKELNVMLDALLTDNGQKDIAKGLKQMQLEWIEGDVEGLATYFTEIEKEAASETNKRLLGERDKNMARKLADMLEKEGENTSFVVVGAGHFVTKGMMIDLLKEKGYDVQLVK
ncbi:TraB/GumN family protein [Paenibacillus sp. 481]|uniref:TraB/GumN family protein n=1 Tax=Paenibacillus sp. 481 TaxID=2835869 RepID=UPI001E3FAABC|nr:TraB/GumN family protein [Paenibacillus sp. 481]UHA72504.1 TraB/GumN family protein [Paenibacillus sp. 481]